MGTIGWPELIAAAPFVCLGAAVLVAALLFLLLRRRR
jgi:hypothetical protein